MFLHAMRIKILVLLLLASSPLYAVWVSEKHECYPAIQEVLAGKLLDEKPIVKGDSRKTCLVKILTCRYVFLKNDSTKIEDFNNYYGSIRKAFELYPDDPLFRAYYAESMMLGSNPTPEKVPAFCSAIVMLSGISQESALVPKIPHALYSIFDTIYINYKAKKVKNTGILRTPLEFLKAYDDTADPEELLLLMKEYWCAHIDSRYCGSGKSSVTPAEVEKCRSKFQNPELHEKAIALWLHLLKSSERMIFESELENYQAQRREENIKFIKAKNEKEAQERLKKALSNLSKLKSSELSIDLITSVLNSIYFAHRELEAYADIPNYDELKAFYKGSNKAEIINLYYSYIVKNKRKELIDKIDRIDPKGSDQLLLKLKLNIMSRLNYPNGELLGVIDQLLKLDPENYEVFMLKRKLSAEEEYEQIKNQSKE